MKGCLLRDLPRPPWASPSQWKAHSRPRKSPISTLKASRRQAASTAPIALIDEKASRSSWWFLPQTVATLCTGKVVSNIQEVRARGAFTIVIAEEGDEAVSLPRRPPHHRPGMPLAVAALLATVPCDFACALAEAKGLDVDQPRNLAKSVTVEKSPEVNHLSNPRNSAITKGRWLEFSKNSTTAPCR